MKKTGESSNTHRQQSMWCFDPNDWETLWKEIFSESKIEVKTKVYERKDGKDFANSRHDGDGSGRVTMEWYIRRL